MASRRSVFGVGAGAGAGGAGRGWQAADDRMMPGNGYVTVGVKCASQRDTCCHHGT